MKTVVEIRASFDWSSCMDKGGLVRDSDLFLPVLVRFEGRAAPELKQDKVSAETMKMCKYKR